VVCDGAGGVAIRKVVNRPSPIWQWPWISLNGPLKSLIKSGGVFCGKEEEM
jgi:hypothetical protein